jgi:alkylation response protein AidB-like acyl-CoA dehydrogenase
VDLRDSASEAKFRRELRDWLAQAVPAHGPRPSSRDWSTRRAYDAGWQRRLYDAGYSGVSWPAEHGGRGATPLEQLVYHEEIARAGAPYIGVNFVGQMHGGPTLAVEGTPGQKARHLPAILRGEQIWCQGFSEPQAGSDLANLGMRARRDGDHYVVSGRKIWTTYAQVADYCELLVRTDPTAPRHRGISWLVMPMDSPGIEIRPLATLEGESEFNELFLDEVRVPVDCRVGEENDGWRIANVTLRFERGTAFAGMIAALRQALERMSRIAGGRGSRRELGRLRGEADALWALVKLSVSQSGRSGVPALGGSAVKLAYTELFQRVHELGTRLLRRGARAREDFAGLPTRAMLHDYFWSIQSTISAGTSQIQRNIIAERILGLPKERSA